MKLGLEVFTLPDTLNQVANIARHVCDGDRIMLRSHNMFIIFLLPQSHIDFL
jgi:hypothetical protein